VCRDIADYLQNRMTYVKSDARKFFVHQVLHPFITGSASETLAACSPEQKSVLAACSVSSFWDTVAHGETLRARLSNAVRAEFATAVVANVDKKLNVTLFAKWRDAAKNVGLVTIPERTLHCICLFRLSGGGSQLTVVLLRPCFICRTYRRNDRAHDGARLRVGVPGRS
jgi:hypothetical protein